MPPSALGRAPWHPKAVTDPGLDAAGQPSLDQPGLDQPGLDQPSLDQPSIDVVDESFIRVRREVLAALVAERWPQWWSNLTLQVYMDRGLEGLRWTVAGEMVGSAELWLEEQQPGVIVHYYLRAEPTVPGTSTTARPPAATRRARSQIEALRRRHVLSWKRIVWAMKDELEADARSYR